MRIRNTYNPIMDTDAYKQSHPFQYPTGAEYISSYIEPRGGKWETVVFHGLQRFIDQYMTVQVTQEHIERAARMCKAATIPFFREGWEYIVSKHNGYIPVEIRALPEGTVLPYKNAMVQVINTDPKCAWITSFIETKLLRAVWYPVTVATQSYNIRERIRAYMEMSCDTIDKLPFMLNDFGARGVSSLESCEIGGVAHLLNFAGTDNLPALMAVEDWYSGVETAGYSVPAAEHSTITSWGRENEADAYRNMIEQFGGEYPLISVVSDSYNIFDACREIWGVQLKQMVQDSGSTLVVRPDSGEIVPTLLAVIDILADAYGTTTNSKGYKVLADCVRIIQGDGINYDTIDEICQAVLARGYSMDNLVFGMGGALLQGIDRDTEQFAMKANAIRIDGEWKDVYKDPIGGGKTSKRGRLAVVRRDGKIVTIRLEEKQSHEVNLLEPVYRDGKVLRHTSFAQMRDRVNQGL